MDWVRKLIDLVEASGSRITFDSRRYARAALDWPEHLPPMFAEAAIAVEAWGMDEWSMWVALAPSDWPVPTVRVGELWEQKSALFETWEEAERNNHYPYRIARLRVSRIAGCRFFAEGSLAWWPMSEVGPRDWRLLERAP